MLLRDYPGYPSILGGTLELHPKMLRRFCAIKNETGAGH